MIASAAFTNLMPLPILLDANPCPEGPRVLQLEQSVEPEVSSGHRGPAQPKC